MYELLDPATRELYSLERFGALHGALSELSRAASVTAATAGTGDPGRARARTAVRRRSPRRPRRLPPRRIPRRHRPSRRRPARASIPPPCSPGRSAAWPCQSGSRSTPSASGHSGWIASLTFVEGPDGWLVRWSPEVLFPELGSDGDLRLDRELGPRGRIVGVDGTVWAETREDGARVYPQEALAGQAIGYVTEVTAEDLESLDAEGYLAGDVVGRSGLEAGARGRAAGHARLAARGSRRRRRGDRPLRDRDGAGRRRDDHPRSRAPGGRRERARGSPRRVRGRGSRQRRRLGPRQRSRLQPELHDDRDHGRRRAARRAGHRRHHQQGGAGRAGRRGPRSSPSRSPPHSTSAW